MSEQQLAEPAPAHPAAGAADGTTTPAIELRGVVKEFRSHGESVTAVRDMNIAITEGEGVIEQLAQPRDIYEHPKSRFVAGFIGTSNLLGGTVTRTEAAGSAVIEFGFGERIIVPAPDARPGDKLEITVRPEKMTLTSGESDNPERGGAGGSGGRRQRAGECLRPPRHRHRGRLPRHLHQLQRDHVRGRGGRGLQSEHQRLG